MIHLEDVEKTYRTPGGCVRALAGVSLDVAPGDFVVVRGPSGCGKSTLLNLVGGLATPSSGRVRVAGEDLATMSSAARARFRSERIGFVFQTFHLLPYLTVVENVAAGANRIVAPTARQWAEKLLNDFQLAHRLRHRPAELSAGECQRVAIARALINQPQLVLADEPTGNLDPENGRVVLNLLADFHRQGGTMLLVTHQEVASDYSPRTVLLRNGLIEGDTLQGRNLAKETPLC